MRWLLYLKLHGFGQHKYLPRGYVMWNEYNYCPIMRLNYVLNFTWIKQKFNIISWKYPQSAKEYSRKLNEHYYWIYNSFLLFMFFLKHWRCISPWFDTLCVEYSSCVAYQLSARQDKRVDELNLFIDYHMKYIVSIIWARHILTLHLSNANCCKPSSATLYWQLQECYITSTR